MFRRLRPPDDFSAEIRAHIELETERLVGIGWPPHEARLAAHRAFGNVAGAEERFYESRRVRWLDELRQDLRAARRSVRRYPVAALVAVISLAGGIGETAATLTVRDVVFHRPPPLYLDARQLSQVQVGTPERPIMPLGSLVPGALYRRWADDPAIGAELAGALEARVHDVRTPDRLSSLRVRAVTPNLFIVLGVHPALGRTIEPREARQPLAVVSDRIWRTLLDARPDAVGRPIWIDDAPYTVAGVMPPRFWFSDMNATIWIALDPAALRADDQLEVIGRRAPGVTGDAFASALRPELASYASRLPAAERQLRLKVSPVEGTPLGKQVSVVLPWLLAASVLLTLIIACANVAILMIAQWTGREHEIAIRASLGASRGRIVRSLIAESVALAGAGGALGLGVALAFQTVMIWRAGPSTLLYELSIDPRILIAAILITLATGVAAGLAPALYETRRLQANPLHGLATADRVRQRWRHTLVVAEITVTVSLLVVTGAMLDGYRRSMAAAVGFDTKPLISEQAENGAGVPIAKVLEAVAAVPGVSAVAAATAVPYAATGLVQPVSAEGGTATVKAEQVAVSVDFFETLGVPMRAGRHFTVTDSDATRSAVVNETLARRLFAASDPSGRRVLIGSTAYEVVGVVANYANHSFQQTSEAAKVFVPLSTAGRARTRVPLIIRAIGDPAPLVEAIRRAIRATAPGTTVSRAYTLDQVIAIGGQEILVGTAPLVPLILTGTILTAAGIYGVLAFAIARRSKELAVRIAIGATAADVVGLVARHSLRLIAAGVVLGIGVTFGLTRIVRASGGGGSIFDPAWPAFVAPLLIVVGIGAIATWIPARRARQIDPALLLRTD
jgi:predicted permease